MSIKINKLEIENVKRVKAVVMEPTQNGLTIIGGNNNQGKTSVLDSIAWSLGGEKYRPSEPRRDGSVIPPSLHVELSNGFVVERKGKNSDLKVIDPAGNKGGQQLLNEFVEQFALDLPKFIQANNKEKAKTLLQIIGVGEQLYKLENEEQQLFNQRHTIGQIADQKKKHAAELITYPEAPVEPVSASELIRQQQEILARNGENQRKRERKQQYEREVAMLQIQFDELKRKLEIASENMMMARKDTLDLFDESTEALEKNITDIEEINRKVRANMDKERAEADAEEYSRQYADLTTGIEAIRKSKIDLLDGANLPLQGLAIADGELTYKGYKWDNLSGSDQLRVSTAIVRKLNPNCGFVLLDKLEQMDLNTLKEFGLWLESEGLQAIATRVSSGDECSIIITDGYGGEVPLEAQQPTMEQKWKAGEF